MRTLLREVNPIHPVAAKIKVIEYKRKAAFRTLQHNRMACAFNQRLRTFLQQLLPCALFQPVTLLQLCNNLPDLHL